MTDLTTAIEVLMNLADSPSVSNSPNPRKRLTYSQYSENFPISSGKKSCIPEFHYLNNSQQKPVFEVSFQAHSSDDESLIKGTDSFDILKDVSESQDKILEKANVLLELQTSKTTRFSETYRTSLTEHEKSSFYLKSPDKSKKKQLETVKRLYNRQEKAKEKIEDLRHKEKEKEDKNLYFQPKISEKSKLLLTGRKKPLFLRTEEVLKQRKDEIERLKRMRKQENETFEKELTFKPEILRKKKGKRDIQKDFEDWKRRKDEKIQKMNVEMIKRDFEELTFKPNVNELSRKIVERRKRRALIEKSENFEEKIMENNENNEKNRENEEENRENSMKKKENSLKKRENSLKKRENSLKKIENSMKKIEKRENSKKQGRTIGFLKEKQKNNENKENFLLKNTTKTSEIREKNSQKKNITNTKSSSIADSKENSRSNSKKLETLKKAHIKPENPTIPIENKVNIVKFEPEMDFLLNLLKK